MASASSTTYILLLFVPQKHHLAASKNKFVLLTSFISNKFEFQRHQPSYIIFCVLSYFFQFLDRLRLTDSVNKSEDITCYAEVN